MQRYNNQEVNVLSQRTTDTVVLDYKVVLYFITHIYEECNLNYELHITTLYIQVCPNDLICFENTFIHVKSTYLGSESAA